MRKVEWGKWNPTMSGGRFKMDTQFDPVIVAFCCNF